MKSGSKSYLFEVRASQVDRIVSAKALRRLCSRNVQEQQIVWWLDQSEAEEERAEEVRKVGRNLIMQGPVEYGMIISFI